jgi:hypothetical protein
MNALRKILGFALPALVLAGLGCMPALAQDPSIIVPVVDTALPIVVAAVKPKPLPAGIAKFDGTVMNATSVQITVKAKGDDMAMRTFPLAPAASAKMQDTIAKGGYQYGDKVSVLYDQGSQQAVKIKGKPSKSL